MEIIRNQVCLESFLQHYCGFYILVLNCELTPVCVVFINCFRESNNILTSKQTLKLRMSCWLVKSIIIDLHSEVDLLIDSLVVQHRYIHLLRKRKNGCKLKSEEFLEK
uniref:Uncharacterized protein n=1 Tax=Micrurus spixii TaxID=129469 RepID=A0A2D4LHE0_9SAUR